MKKIIGLCFLLVFLPTLGCSDSPAPQTGVNSNNPKAIRILPLGDSITQANDQNLSYRYWLWNNLAEQNIAADFVGTQDSNHEGNPDYPPTFDLNHQGHWGWRTDEVLEKLPQWLQHYRADISLVHLGTNDCLKNQPVEETLAELEQIVTLLRQDNPNIDVIFSPLGPTTWKGSECLTKINQGLKQIVSRLHTSDSHVLLAEFKQPLDPQSQLYDGLHPNAEGEQVIADMWSSAIRNVVD